MASARIMIVEDEIKLAKGIADSLEKLGYAVPVIVSSGEEAIRRAAETRPDLVLADIGLKGEIDGVEAVEEICERLDIPVVYLTNYADDGILERATVTKPFSYVLKPLDVKELHSTIEMALYRHEMERRLRESEARYRIVSELTADFAYAVRVQPDGRVELEWATEALTHVTGLTLEEMEEPSAWMSLINADDMSTVLEGVQSVLSGGSVRTEFRIATVSGETRWLRVHGRSVWDKAQDRAVRVVGAVRDITERKQAEEELRRHREHLEEIVEQRTAELVEANEQLQQEISEREQVTEEIRRRSERVATLNTIITAAVSSLEADIVLHQILELTCLTLGAVGGSILLSEQDAGESFFAVIIGGDADVLRGRRLAPGQGIAGWVTQHGQAVCANDVRQDPRWYDGVDKVTGFQTRSLLCAPLMYRGKVTGVMEIVNKHEGEFTDDDLSLLEAVASIAAVALENAHLHATIRAHVEELALLNEMGLALTATLDPATVVHAALHQTKRLFQARGVSLLEPDRQTGELRYVWVLFGTEEVELPIRLAPGTGIAGWALANRQLVLVEDAQSDPRLSHQVDEYLGHKTRALMAAPLCTPKRVIGVIEVVSDEPGIYTRNELRTLQAIASALSVALENARLYDELKAALKAREQAQVQLIQTEKMAALGRLLASLAHEINNPLQALRSSLSLLMNRQPSEEKRQIYLSLAHQEVERLISIVERVLGFYRPSKEGSELTDINAAVDETLLLVSKQLEHGRVSLRRHSSADLPLVEAVASQLKQVFLNIILNALQAMPKGGELAVETGWDATVGEVRVAFTDMGVGIPDDEMALLFEPFFTSRSEGTGLGLAISYSIVDQHGGRIEVESEVGVGSTFTVVLPVAAGTQDRSKRQRLYTGYERA